MQLLLDHPDTSRRGVRHRVFVPIGGVHRGTTAALRYAHLLSDDVTVVHVSIDPAEADRQLRISAVDKGMI
jgi:hypothetical protein